MVARLPLSPSARRAILPPSNSAAGIRLKKARRRPSHAAISIGEKIERPPAGTWRSSPRLCARESTPLWRRLGLVWMVAVWLPAERAAYCGLGEDDRRAGAQDRDRGGDDATMTREPRK